MNSYMNASNIFDYVLTGSNGIDQNGNIKIHGLIKSIL